MALRADLIIGSPVGCNPRIDSTTLVIIVGRIYNGRIIVGVRTIWVE